jgi:hypothetical protein
LGALPIVIANIGREMVEDLRIVGGESNISQLIIGKESHKKSPDYN